MVLKSINPLSLCLTHTRALLCFSIRGEQNFSMITLSQVHTWISLTAIQFELLFGLGYYFAIQLYRDLLILRITKSSKVNPFRGSSTFFNFQWIFLVQLTITNSWRFDATIYTKVIRVCQEFIWSKFRCNLLLILKGHCDVSRAGTMVRVF